MCWSWFGQMWTAAGWWCHRCWPYSSPSSGSWLAETILVGWRDKLKKVCARYSWTPSSERRLFVSYFLWSEPELWQHTLVRPTSDLTVFVTEFGFNTSHCAHQKWFDQGPSQPRFTFHIIGFTSVALINIQQAAAAWLSISYLPLSHPRTWNEQCRNLKHRKITTF